MIKISEIENGMIIWNNKGEILGITGNTLPEEYYQRYAIKVAGNYYDYILIDSQIGSNLDRMKQYPIDRQLFVNIFGNAYNEFYDKFYDIETESFKCWYDDDDFYILHLNSGTLINWYKHLGRCLTCNKDLSINEYKYLSNLLYKELKDSDDNER